MRLRSAATAGHMLPVGPVCSHRHCVKLVAWIPLFYCGSYILPLRCPGVNDNRDEIDKVGQSNYHGDPAAALLEVLDPEQNVAFNVRHFNVSYLYMTPDTTQMIDRITTSTCRSIYRKFFLSVRLIPSIRLHPHFSIDAKQSNSLAIRTMRSYTSRGAFSSRSNSRKMGCLKRMFK